MNQSHSHRMHRSLECHAPLHTAFIKREKAFSSARTATVMQALHNQGVDEPYINLRDNAYLQGLRSNPCIIQEGQENTNQKEFHARRKSMCYLLHPCNKQSEC